MTLDLPEAVASYFVADQTGDSARLAQCFIPAAIVKDERETHRGRDAILAWKAASSAKYRYTVEPLSMVVDGPRFVVTGHLEGDFPGSPIDLRYIFELQGEQIAALEIVP